jgi:hypothetical protein
MTMSTRMMNTKIRKLLTSGPSMSATGKPR